MVILFTQDIFYQNQHDCLPPTHPTCLTWPLATVLFPAILTQLRRSRQNRTAVLNILTECDLQGTSRKWQNHLEQCLRAERNYFEGLNSWVLHPVARVSLSSSSTVRNSSLCFTLYYTIHTTCFGLTAIFRCDHWLLCIFACRSHLKMACK
jgi:hypothetical protein